MRNIEIKARADDLDRLRDIAAALTTSPAEMLDQKDTFYDVPSGRLKLREIAGQLAELIFYQRTDTERPKASHYVRSPVADPSSMHELLARFARPCGVVEKRREVLMVGRTRIHLDQVLDLGNFMELETVLAENESEAEGEKALRDLMTQLAIDPADLIAGAYLDLLDQGGASSPSTPTGGGDRQDAAVAKDVSR